MNSPSREVVGTKLSFNAKADVGDGILLHLTNGENKMRFSTQACTLFWTCIVVLPSLQSDSAIYETKVFVFEGHRGKTPHVFSIAGVDVSPSIWHFSCFTVCFCQVWLETVCLLPNLNEHLFLFQFNNSAQIMRQQGRLTSSLQAVGGPQTFDIKLSNLWAETKLAYSCMTFGRSWRLPRPDHFVGIVETMINWSLFCVFFFKQCLHNALAFCLILFNVFLHLFILK